MTVLAGDGPLQGDVAMNAVTAPKSDRMNRFEGFALIALLQGFPIFASTVLLLKLMGSHQIVSNKFGAAIFVALATPVYAWITPVLVRKFPKLFRNSHEPVFYDAGLSFSEKIAQWRTQPKASSQLLATVIMLSLLAVAVASKV
jgi:hypothetical protein